MRHRRVVHAIGRGAVGLLRPRDAFDDRVNRLEMARVGREHDGRLPRVGGAAPDGPEVVLDVAARAFRRRRDGLDRALALELAQDLLVGAVDDVGEDVQSAPVRHADHDPMRARLGSELDGLVEHWHQHVQAFDRELLLSEEGATQVVLEDLDLRQLLEQSPVLLRRERLPVTAGLDRLPEPDSLLVVGDVLDLVGDRPAVGLLEPGQDVRERLSFEPNPQHRGRNLRLELGCQPGDEPLWLERRVADRLGAEGVEVRCEVPVHPVGLDEGHRSRDRAKERLVGLRARRGRFSGGGNRGLWRRGRRLRRSWGRDFGRWRGRSLRSRRGTVLLAQRRQQPGEPRQRFGQPAVAALEERTPLLGHRLGVLEVLLEEPLGIAHVQIVDIAHAHQVRSSTRSPCGGA